MQPITYVLARMFGKGKGFKGKSPEGYPGGGWCVGERASHGGKVRRLQVQRACEKIQRSLAETVKCSMVRAVDPTTRSGTGMNNTNPANTLAETEGMQVKKPKPGPRVKRPNRDKAEVRAVNYHTLADFRVKHDDWLNDLLTKSVAALIADGLVTMHRVSQDGKHVRASAGSGSFRRREKLEAHLQAARTQVERLREELESDPQATSTREKAARQLAVKEPEQRLTKALARLNEIEKPKQSSREKRQPTQKTSKQKRKREMRKHV
ncbi:MAG: hypothetical protein AB1894_14605 [Chloroflexota bacterium]